MKRMLTTFALAVLIGLNGFAQNAELKQEIEVMYQKYAEMVNAKKLDGVMDFFDESFIAMGGVGDRDQIQKSFESLFSSYEEIQTTLRVDTVRAHEDNLTVQGFMSLRVRADGSSEWQTLVDDDYFDMLEKKDGEWKLISSAQIDKRRQSHVSGTTYTHPVVGYSYSLPSDWELLTSNIHPMQGGALLVAPDGGVPGFFGYVEVPYNVTAKQAIDGDDAAMKNLIPDSKIIQSGEFSIGSYSGYESVSTFTMNDEGLKRRRVYLMEGGLLYVFVVTTTPDKWEINNEMLDEVLTSFSLTAESKEQGSQLARSEYGSGEVNGQIYSNQELGCQIAAPDGWTIESTPLGHFDVSISMKPSEGVHLFRLLANPLPSGISVEDVFKQELGGIESMTKDYTLHEDIHEIEFGNHEGLCAVFTFTMDGLGTYKRKYVMANINETLYLFLCDAQPVEMYEEMLPVFDGILSSFTVN